MKFRVTFASDRRPAYDLEIETLDDLRKLQAETDPTDGLIVDFRNALIVVYDDYVE